MEKRATSWLALLRLWEDSQSKKVITVVKSYAQQYLLFMGLNDWLGMKGHLCHLVPDRSLEYLQAQLHLDSLHSLRNESWSVLWGCCMWSAIMPKWAVPLSASAWLKLEKAWLAVVSKTLFDKRKWILIENGQSTLVLQMDKMTSFPIALALNWHFFKLYFP